MTPMATNNVQSEKDVIIIGGKQISTKTTKLDISDLKYYPENPRINSIVAKLSRPLTQKAIENAIYDEDSVHELLTQIKNNGGLIDPILVKGDVVIEGNCRLCCYRQLYRHSNDGEKGIWQEIPARVLPSNLTEEEIFILLGTIHVTAKTPWDPFERASYIWRMSKKLKKSWEEIAKLLGMEKGEVWRSAQVYDFMKEYKMRDIKKFSYIDEFFRSTELRKMYAADKSFGEDIVDWVNTERIPDAQSMRDLFHILNDKIIGPKFRSGRYDFQDAYDATRKRNPELSSGFYKKIGKMQIALEKAKTKKIRKEIKKDPRKKTKIKRFLRTVDQFKRDLKM